MGAGLPRCLEWKWDGPTPCLKGSYSEVRRSVKSRGLAFSWVVKSTLPSGSTD